MAVIDVNISRVDNGYVVRAGCMTLAFNNRAELAVELTRWLENPEAVEKEYIAKYRRDGGSLLRGGGVPFPGGITGSVEAPPDRAETIQGLERSRITDTPVRRRPFAGDVADGSDGPDSLGHITRT